MNTLLYAITIMLIIGWALGFFALHTNDFIHLLLLFAMVAVLVRIIRGRKPI